MQITKHTEREASKEVSGTPRLIFDKVCKCGNRMGITLTKDTGGTELQVTERADGAYSCFMIGDSTAECNSCHRRARSYHRAYVVEARLSA